MHYQLCPKCNGQGYVSKPPWVAGDIHNWTSTAGSFPCDVCGGNKILLAPDNNYYLSERDRNLLKDKLPGFNDVLGIFKDDQELI